jgi:hypothetical protein
MREEHMMNELTAALTWLPVFLVLGAVIHVVDHHLGSRIYRWWYNMTHRDPLPKEIIRGFVFEQPARVRFQVAIILAALQSGLAAFGGANPIIELLTVIVEVPVAMVGFYCGPFLDQIWTRKDTVFDTVDKLEKGELSVGEEMRKASAEAVETIKEAFIGEEEESKVPAHETAPPKEEVIDSEEKEDSPTHLNEEEDDVDPRELIRKYTSRDA